MKPFIALMMMAAAASAEVTSNSAINSAGNPNVVAGSPMANAGFNGNMMSTTFAESRHADTYGAPAAPIVDSYSSPQASAWAADPAPAAAYPYSFTQSAPSGGLGFSANADVGFPGQGFLNTTLTIVFALVGFSLLIQLVTKIMAAPFIADLFEGRSLSHDNVMVYTNMAMNGIQKLQEIYEGLE